MSDRIEPAPNEIERAHAIKGDPTADDIAASLRYLNSRLPDSDPRKITREWIAAIRGAEPIGTESYRGYDEKAIALLAQIADALESYLPPEP